MRSSVPSLFLSRRQFLKVTVAAVALAAVAADNVLALAAPQPVALSSTLTWSNPVNTTDQLQVEKASSPTGQFVAIAALAPNSTSYINSNELAGTTSCYRVAYLLPTGIGNYAGPVCKTFPKRKGKPQR